MSTFFHKLLLSVYIGALGIEDVTEVSLTLADTKVRLTVMPRLLLYKT